MSSRSVRSTEARPTFPGGGTRDGGHQPRPGGSDLRSSETAVISGLVGKCDDYLPVRYARLQHQTGLKWHLGSGRAMVLTDEGWHRSGGGAHGGDSVPLGMSPRLGVAADRAWRYLAPPSAPNEDA